jgi:hypothetical protein
MPTLDDLPTLAVITPTGDDLLPIYDLTGNGSSKVRKVSLNQINGISAADVTTPAPTGTTAAVTISTRMTRIAGTNTGVTTASLPLPTGALRDVIVQFYNASSTLTVNITGGGSNLFLSGSATAQSSQSGIASGTTARFLSDGTNWYRTH